MFVTALASGLHTGRGPSLFLVLFLCLALARNWRVHVFRQIFTFFKILRLLFSSFFSHGLVTSRIRIPGD